MTYASKCTTTALCWALFCSSTNLPLSIAQTEAQAKLELVVSSSEMSDKAKKIVEGFRNKLVCIASVPKRRERNLKNRQEFDLPSSPSLAPMDPGYIAARYCTGLVWSKGTIITPYSALGDPDAHDYFIWRSGFVAHASVVGAQAKVIAGEPYTNLAALRILDDQFTESLIAVKQDEIATADVGDVCFLVSSSGTFPHSGSLEVKVGTVEDLKRSINSTIPDKQSESSKLEQNNIYAHGGLFHTSHEDFGDNAGSILVLGNGKIIGMCVDRMEGNVLRLSGTYAMPLEQAFRRAADALSRGTLPTYGFLGIQPGYLTSSLQRRNLQGVVVEQLIKGMPGEKAGLKVGDVITHVGGHEIESREAIFRELAAYQPGVPVAFTVRRPRGADILHVDCEVVLSKRYLATKRPAYTLEPQQDWNGVIVDYATAFPPELLFQFFSRYPHFDPNTLAVVSVNPGTKGWDAGFRLGQQIVSINETAVSTPEEFYANAKSDIRTKVIVRDLQGRNSTITTE